MKEQVRVSVVMPTYNDAPHLREAIDSVLNQTYSDLEFIIVNDGSTDETEDIISSHKDPRIRYFKTEKNHGTAYARNIGMREATGEYIAIMDSDDIMHPERLEKQLAFLQSHPEIDFLGSTVIRFSPEGYYYQYFPHDPGYIEAACLFRSLMLQPSITFRRQIILQHNLEYNTGYPVSEDYHFFFQALKSELQFSSLEQPLLYYRVSDSQLSSIEGLHRHDDLIKAFFMDRFSVFSLDLNEEDWEIFYRFTQTRIPITRIKFEKLSAIFDALEKQNKDSDLYPDIDFRAALFFFRLRLIKYEFLEKGEQLRFCGELIKLIAKTGIQATKKFWDNEGKYLNRSGERNMVREVYRTAS